MASDVYSSLNASNGIVLKVFKTSPLNVYPYKISSNVASSNASVGMNGGFFDDISQIICSIVAKNESAIGSAGVYGNGDTNLNASGAIARGTLAWEGTNRKYYLVVVQKLSDFGFTAYSSDNWIQGGISMNLQNDAVWQNQAVNVEGLPSPTALVTRSALLYSNTLNLFLVTTPTGCTAAAFRTDYQGTDRTFHLSRRHFP